MELNSLTIKFPKNITELIFRENWIVCVWKCSIARLAFPNLKSFSYEVLDLRCELRISNYGINAFPSHGLSCYMEFPMTIQISEMRRNTQIRLFNNHEYYSVHYRKDNTKYEGPPKTIHLESRNQSSHEQYDECINNECE